MPRRVLIVEDNPTDALLLRRALTEGGVDYDATVIDDGAKAIEFIDRCEEDRKPELIIVDLNLPKEGGLEVLKKYRSNPMFVKARMAVLTSSDAPSDRSRAELMGVDAYLRKPMDLDDFLALGNVFRKLLEPE
jgi:CheY-like chemotaxis protein